MGLAEVGPLYGAIGWTYVAAASFAIVYLGEHYVADVVVGLAIAELVRRCEPFAAPFVRAVARAIETGGPPTPPRRSLLRRAT
jgi:membrane-associated phospholipid phosphatase